MITLLFENIRYPSIMYNIEILIDDGGADETLYPILEHKGPVTIGNPDSVDDEDVISPGALSLSFFFPVANVLTAGVFSPSVSDADQTYYEILTKMKQYGATLKVYRMPGEALTYEYHFNDSLISGNSVTRTISVRFEDGLEYLTLPNPGTGLGEYKYIRTFIKELLDDSVLGVNFVTDFRFKYAPNNSVEDTPTACYMASIGALSTEVYDKAYSTKGAILKAILNSFASYGLIGFDRYFYVLPLFFNNAPIITIDPDTTEAPSEVQFQKTYKALARYIQVSRFTSVEYRLTKFAVDDRARIFNLGGWENDPQIKKMNVLFAVGDDADVYPSGDAARNFATNLYYLVEEGDPRKLFAHKVAYKRADGTYSEERSLNQWAGNLMYENYSGIKKTIKEVIPGIGYDFSYYYQRKGISATFRPKAITVDEVNDQTTLLLQQCVNADNYLNPVVTVFNKILKAFSLKLEIKRGGSWVEYTGSANEIIYNGEQLRLSWDDPYDCGSTTATEYDDIGLTISDEELGVWRDNFTIPIYIAIGKTRTTSAPASAYPVPPDGDEDADWYLLRNLPVEKRFKEERVYYNIRAIESRNPFWFWVGIKSSNAQLFDDIPVYEK